MHEENGLPVSTETSEKVELSEVPETPEKSETPETPAEPAPTEKKKSIGATVFEYVEMFAWSVFAVLLIFTFGVRLCEVDGQSMEDTLHDGERLLLVSAGYTPKQDDIVVFHLTKPEKNLEKTLVKRVIAVGGQTLTIDTNTGVITVDGVVYEDEHSVLKSRNTGLEDGGYDTRLFTYDYDKTTGIFSTTVPEGYIFVMGDNRNNSKDSRNLDVGFVDERCVLGRVVLRLNPFAIFD